MRQSLTVVFAVVFALAWAGAAFAYLEHVRTSSEIGAR
jgi:hypothetical protein